jgi:hypothetical protein
VAVAVDWMLSETSRDASAAELDNCRVTSVALVNVRQRADQLPDHGLEFARGAVHGLGAAHFGASLPGGKLVGGLLRNHGVLENLYGVGDLADFGALALMGNLRVEVAGGERAHRGQDRADATGNVTDDQDSGAKADQHHDDESRHDNAECHVIGVFRHFSGGGRAFVVEFDEFREHGVHAPPRDRRPLGVDGAGLGCVALAGMGNHFIACFEERGPCLRQILVKRGFLR